MQIDQFINLVRVFITQEPKFLNEIMVNKEYDNNLSKLSKILIKILNTKEGEKYHKTPTSATHDCMHL